jgi:hypothetical protein
MLQEILKQKTGLLKRRVTTEGPGCPVARIASGYELFWEGLSQGLKGRKALEPLGELFFAALADCCLNEGLRGYSTPEDEAALKDRLPDTVANWITALSAIFSGHGGDGRFIRPEETAGILLLRLLEWKQLNYQGDLLYGRAYEEGLKRRFKALAHEFEMWGDMDEACHMFLNGLSDCGISQGDFTVDPGVRYLLMGSDAPGSGLVMGVKMAAFDKLLVRLGPEASPHLPCMIDGFRSSADLGTLRDGD